MKKGTLYYIRKYLDDYAFKTYASTMLALFIDILFIFYNGFIGFTDRSAWHHSIWFYYILLFLIRALLIYARRTGKHVSFFITVTGLFMIILILSLSFPIYALIKGIRNYGRELVEAIVIAAYTTIKVTQAIRNLLKARNTKDILIMRLRCLTLMDALFSILILQNTLIMTVDGKIEGGMLYLSIASSLIISLIIILISFFSFFGGKKALQKD